MTGIAAGRLTGPGAGESHAAVIRTDDGGATWSVRHVSSGTDEWAWKISFPTASVGYVAVQGFAPAAAKVLKTTDGGLTWTELPLPPGTFFSGIGFVDAQSGWVGGSFPTPNGSRSLAVTTDGGLTWSVIDDLTDPSVINRIRFFSFAGEPVGWASGGAVYRYQPAGTPIPPVPPEAATILGAPIPNPFAGASHLPFTIPRAGHVRLEVFDSLGRRVATLVDGRMEAGRHEVRWDGTDRAERPLPAGVYIYRLEAGDVRRAGEAILFR
jgi:hypothetical protein